MACLPALLLNASLPGSNSTAAQLAAQTASPPGSELPPPDDAPPAPDGDDEAAWLMWPGSTWYCNAAWRQLSLRRQLFRTWLETVALLEDSPFKGALDYASDSDGRVAVDAILKLESLAAAWASLLERMRARCAAATCEGQGCACVERATAPSVLNATQGELTARSEALLNGFRYEQIREACGPLVDAMLPPSHCYYTEATVALVARMFARDVDFLQYSEAEMYAKVDADLSGACAPYELTQEELAARPPPPTPDL